MYFITGLIPQASRVKRALWSQAGPMLLLAQDGPRQNLNEHVQPHLGVIIPHVVKLFSIFRE